MELQEHGVYGHTFTHMYKHEWTGTKRNCSTSKEQYCKSIIQCTNVTAIYTIMEEEARKQKQTTPLLHHTLNQIPNFLVLISHLQILHDSRHLLTFSGVRYDLCSLFFSRH